MQKTIHRPDFSTFDLRNPPKLQLRAPWYRYLNPYFLFGVLQKARSGNSILEHDPEKAAYSFLHAAANELPEYNDNIVTLKLHAISALLTLAQWYLDYQQRAGASFCRQAMSIAKGIDREGTLARNLTVVITAQYTEAIEKNLSSPNPIQYAVQLATEALYHLGMHGYLYGVAPVTVPDSAIIPLFVNKLNTVIERGDFHTVASLFHQITIVGFKQDQFLQLARRLASRAEALVSSGNATKAGEAYEAAGDISPITFILSGRNYYDDAKRCNPDSEEYFTAKYLERVGQYASVSDGTEFSLVELIHARE